MRAEFAQAMIALFRQRRDLVFITGDVGYMALEDVAETYGERFINAGIAEQNAVSLAAGLAREGHLPWVYSTAPFVVLRPYEQIRNDVCLHRLAGQARRERRRLRLRHHGGDPSRPRGRRCHARAAQHEDLPAARPRRMWRRGRRA